MGDTLRFMGIIAVFIILMLLVVEKNEHNQAKVKASIEIAKLKCK